MKKKFGIAMILSVLISLIVLPLLGFAEENTAGEEVTKKDKEKKGTIKSELPEIVVTATRTETPQEETTKSVSVVTKKDMEEQQQYFMPELLDNQPGVFFRPTGGLGRWGTITIRGASERYTQFQFNGMPLRDVADPQSSLSYFTEDLFGTTGLDRIEVLKGTNSTLYGSAAVGGVINIIPKKWQDGITGELRNEIGPNNTYIGNGRLAYGKEKFYLDINPLYLTTDGEKVGGRYGFYYKNKGGTLGAGIKPFENNSLEFSGLVYDSDLALGSSPSLDAHGNLIKQQAYPDQHRESQLYQLGLIWNHKVFDSWDYTVKGSYGATERHYFWSRPLPIKANRSEYDGNTTYLEMQHNVHPFHWLTLNIGADYENATYKGQEPSSPAMGDYTPVHFRERWGTWDIFSQAQFALLDRSLFFTLGGRYNNPEAFSNKTVWEASGAYLLKSTRTKFHAHVGTGYRTPSLYETYGGYVWSGTLVTIGNPNLKPEESLGYEFGIDQSFLRNKVQVGATYFNTRFKNWIGFDMRRFRYANANRAKLSGVEAYIRTKPFPWLKLDLAYTYTSTKAEEANGDWVRGSYQPRNKFNWITTLYPLNPLSRLLPALSGHADDLTVVCNVGYLSDKIIPLYDPSYNRVNWEEKSRWIVDLAATYKLLKFMDLFVRVKNLFDKEYTESGYYMPGRSIYGGVKLYF